MPSRLTVGDGPHDCWFQPHADEHDWRAWHHPYSHATVAVILENAAHDIALVERRPAEPTEGDKLALPGGYVELGQSLSHAAETETREETGRLILPKTLGIFAIMDGPSTLPGRRNESNLNVVHVFTAQAGEEAHEQEQDEDITGVQWINPNNLPPRERIAFGHYDILGMWLRHQAQPFDSLPIIPSGMTIDQLFLPEWSE